MSNKDEFVADLFTKPIVISPNKKQREEALSLQIKGGLILVISIFIIIYTFTNILPYMVEQRYDDDIYTLIVAMVIASPLYLGIYIIMEGNKKARINFTGYIDEISPYQFELLIEDLYSKQNYKCTKLKHTGDSGADVIATKDNVKYVIQVKHYDVNNKVGNRVVRDVYGAIKMYDANKGIIVTTSYFTKPAVEAANKTGIVLIDREKLGQMIYETYYNNSI